MKTLKPILILSMIFALIIIGCKKYDDGPYVSLKTKKMRLCRIWQLDETIYANGSSYSPATNNTMFLDFQRDGTVILSGSSGGTSKGTWVFSSDKESITFTWSYPFGNSYTSKILRLTSRELWMEDNADELHFIKKQ